MSTSPPRSPLHASLHLGEKQTPCPSHSPAQLPQASFPSWLQGLQAARRRPSGASLGGSLKGAGGIRARGLSWSQGLVALLSMASAKPRARAQPFLPEPQGLVTEVQGNNRVPHSAPT